MAIEIKLSLASDEAEALAEMVKRASWGDIRMLAVDDQEATVMLDGIRALRKALAESGFAPR